MSPHSSNGLDLDAVAYLNPAALALCCQDQCSPRPDKPGAPAACRGLYRGQWKPGVAYARGDVVYICPDYEEPVEENLYRSLRTHCASENERPESGPLWRKFWQIRLRPEQDDDLDEFGPGVPL